MQNVRRFRTLKGDDAREALLRGVFFGADAVRRTLGPYGKNWISGVRGGTPHITNDGVSILKLLWLPDEIENLGLRAMREAALKTNEIAGDGTTTAATLAYAVLAAAARKLGYTVIDPANGKFVRGTAVGSASAMEIKRRIDAECKTVIEELVKMAKPVESREQLIAAALVAVEDQQLAEMIGGMQYDLGAEGTILVDDTNDEKDSIERVNGIRFDNGFPTSRVINNQEKQTLELADVHVILTNDIIKSLLDFRSPNASEGAGILDVLTGNLSKAGKKKEIVIVAKKFDQLAMSEIAENMKAGVAIFPINAPFVNQTQVFKDLAALLGGTFVDVEENRRVSDMTLADVGYATRMQASRWNAIFAGISDERAKNRINERIRVIEKEMKGEESVFAKNMLQSRISQLQNGLALMKVGGKSEAEQKRKRDKVDDGVNATRAALQEGIVPGSGQALKDIADRMPQDGILTEAIKAPYQQIQANAGPAGFEVQSWVKDPVKVVRVALDMACSVAGNLATTEGAIDHELPKPRYMLTGETEEGGGGPDGTNL